MDSSLSICFVSQEYPEETGWGGIGTYTYEMAHGLAREGHRVVVLARGATHRRYYVEEDGVHVYRTLPRLNLSNAHLLWRLNGLWEGYRLAVAIALREIVRHHHIDLIETPDLHAEPVLFRLTRVGRPPLVVRLHSANYMVGGTGPVHARRSRLDRWSEKVMLRLAAAITSPSDAGARHRDPAYSIARRGYRVIPNPVDTSHFRPVHSPEDDSNAEVLFMGRLEPLKGIDVLLRALPLVCENMPEARFTVVGAGMGKSTDSIAEQNAMSLACGDFADRMRVLSRVPHGELPAIYAQAAVCVVPSRWEQFGYTCAEAMACGRAVVASRIGGLAELIEDRVSGLLVEPGDTDALAEAVVRLLGDTELREEMGRAARRRAETMFATGVVAPRMAEFYRGVLGTVCGSV
ncbi:MAG: glycosyltransferase family 1 protein [Chloroflexota bacterium]|nr:MAG: glycosyltransferase family 1 protein [Chloroflexota bacterium]